MARLSERKLSAAVSDIARIASAIFDGELCSQVVTVRSWHWFANFDADDKWSAHDNYDVEHAPFIAAKKMLVRLERLAPAEQRVGCSLWLPVPTLPGRATCVIQNGGPARWQKFGTLHVELDEPMRRALAGEPADVAPDRSGMVTRLAPVFDSFKNAVGFIEVTAAQAEPAINW